jgi:hypothetical protein
MSKQPDWERTGTVCAYAEWIREKSGAIAVFVIRRDDSVLATDSKLPAKEIGDLVVEYLPRLVQAVPAARQNKEKAARLVLGPVPE